MKNLLLLLILPFIGYSKIGESIPDYVVGKTIKDASIKKTEAAFNFTFYSSDIIVMKQTIKASYNSIEKEFATTIKGKYVLKVKPGKYKFQFFYNDKYYEIYTDSIACKKGCRTNVDVYFSPSISIQAVKKPVIYIYSPDTLDVSIKLNTKEKPTFMYPNYTTAWNVKATLNGDLLIENKVYPYLFWEGNIQLQASDINTNEGFLISKENTTSFFEEKLSEMGLTQKEKTDFITFWCPQMIEHKNTFVHFIFNNEIDKYAELDITPKPQNVFRVYMVWTPIDEITFNRVFKEQTIPTVKRDGLTVIEWGGSQSSQLYK
ncbi:MAG: hypothetical protein IPG89_01165 [Bacteroidetes bacterium]|nr:hypothetical protein [Bacteroidota bacterium]